MSAYVLLNLLREVGGGGGGRRGEIRCAVLL